MAMTIRFSVPEIIGQTTSGSLVNCPITISGRAVGYVEKVSKKTGVCEGKIYANLDPEFFEMGGDKRSITTLEMSIGRTK